MHVLYCVDIKQEESWCKRSLWAEIMMGGVGDNYNFHKGRVLNIEEKHAAGVLWQTKALATDGQKNHRNDTKKSLKFEIFDVLESPGIISQYQL